MVQKRGHTGRFGGPKKHMFHESAFVPLAKSCFPPRAGSIFSENTTIFCKKNCSKHGSHKENSRSYTKLTRLLQRCIHSFLLTGLWGRKMHGTAARSNILKRAWSEQMAIWAIRRANKSKSNYKEWSYRGRLGVKKKKSWLKLLEFVLQKCVPRSSRNNNFEKMWCKKWVEAWKA